MLPIATPLTWLSRTHLVMLNGKGVKLGFIVDHIRIMVALKETVVSFKTISLYPGLFLL